MVLKIYQTTTTTNSNRKIHKIRLKFLLIIKFSILEFQSWLFYCLVHLQENERLSVSVFKIKKKWLSPCYLTPELCKEVCYCCLWYYFVYTLVSWLLLLLNWTWSRRSTLANCKTRIRIWRIAVSVVLRKNILHQKTTLVIFSPLNLFLMFLYFCVYSFCQVMNLNSTQIGLIFLVYSLLYALVTPLAGWIGDKTVSINWICSHKIF